MRAPRFAPHDELPQAAFRPGRGARPRATPGAALAAGARCPRGDGWRASRPFLFGVDLYNHGFPWEAHEVWEALWHAARRDPTLAREASLLRGLIQLAAAAVLVRDGRARGAERVARRAATHLRAAAAVEGPPHGPPHGPPVRLLGLEPATLAAQAEALAEAPDGPRPLLEPR